jgi:predicted TIM-barrel fold metal-dependent hydrolase
LMGTENFMIFDVHVHLYPPDVTRRIEKYTRRDPFLKEICSSKGHKYATLEDLLAEMDKCGVERTAVSGFASSDPGLCREMNDYILEAARLFPRRLTAMAVVSPLDRMMEQELDRALKNGACGVGELFPWGQDFALEGEAVERLASYCQERSLPLLLHLNENVGHHYTGKGDISIKEGAEFAAKFPSLSLIFAHWGGGLCFYELMPELKEQLQNVYYDTAATPFLYSKNIYKVVREIGILDKILLGSDYPLISPRRYLRDLDSSGLEPHEKSKIQGENAARLFSLTS